MEFVARRRVGSGTYNPLCDKDVQSTGVQSWVCVSEHAVPYFRSKSRDDPAKTTCKPGATISATKEGHDWLCETASGLYVPVADVHGEELFHNSRRLLCEQVTQDWLHDIVRTTSKESVTSTASGSTEFLRQNSSDSHDVAKRNSFRWVEHDGVSHRLSGTSELLENVDVRPEVFVCVSEDGVNYYSSCCKTAITFKQCPRGAKVTAVKEGNWLKVVEVKATFDFMHIAEMVGRRSLHVPKTVMAHESGLFLPYARNGERLFKNEKALLFEASKEEPVREDHGHHSCAVM